MTFWPLTNSDFPTDQTFHQFHDLYTEFDLHRIMSGFHGAFETGVASQQGTLTLPDTWFRPPFWDLLMLRLLRPNSSNLPWLYSTFQLEYPLVLSRFCLNETYRYMDDVLSINNPDFENYLGQMYPPELEIKDTTESNTSASYLDLLLSIGRDGQLHTSLYDKRDDFNFHITNFPFLSSNIPSSPAYGVFISQLIRYARACSSYECFILRAMRLSNKLLGQGYVKERFKSSLRKFYGRYGDLTKQYEVPLSRMLHDILDDNHIQWHPPLIGHYTNFWPLLIKTLLPNFTFYLIVQGFHRTYAAGAACQQRSCPTLGLACVLMSRPISPELVLSPDLWISNTPRYFSFALDRKQDLYRTLMG